MQTELRSPMIRKQTQTTPDSKKNTIFPPLKKTNKPLKQQHTQNDKQNNNTAQNIQPINYNHNDSKSMKSPKTLKPNNNNNNIKQLDIRSPDRPVYMPSGFRSNKANQCLVNVNQEITTTTTKVNETQVIYSGLSKDSKYEIVSKAFTGKELEKARIYETKINLVGKNIKNAQKLSEKQLPLLDEAKFPTKQNGLIQSYAVNTHQGISRNYNEDRVSVILNINKKGIKSTFFAVYDGHGGTGCCDFLRDYLHEYIINHQSFPQDPRKAIVDGIHRVEARFLDLVKKKFIKTRQLDRSGSCAIIALIVGSDCYTVNVGDSRAFLSKNKGKTISHLSRDHKPADEKQEKRILSNGGKIYRTEMTRLDKKGVPDKSTLTQQEFIIGPLRVYPGKLSVTRTFGDIEAKDRDFQGIPNCVSVQPQIAKFTIGKNDDFIFLGCDGIFQKLESVQVNRLIWRKINEHKQVNMHQVTGKCVDEIIKESMRRKSTDNLTGIMISLKQYFSQENLQQQSSKLMKDTSCRSL